MTGRVEELALVHVELYLLIGMLESFVQVVVVGVVYFGADICSVVAASDHHHLIVVDQAGRVVKEDIGEARTDLPAVGYNNRELL